MRTQKLEAPGHCADGSDSPPKYEWRIAIGRGGLLGSRDQEPNRRDPWGVCVFITAGPSTKLFAWGGGENLRTCATRDDEPRPVWTSLPITH